MIISQVEKSIAPSDFKKNYVDKNKLAIIRGYAKDWPAVRNWDYDFFRIKYGKTTITTKDFKPGGEISLNHIFLEEYMDSIERYGELTANKCAKERPSYWHDVPIFNIYKDLIDDVVDFPVGILPSFYQASWEQYVQFFMSPTGSVTKLHFDTLRTHNIFFQIRGTKKWILLAPHEEKLCGRKRWRWFDIDPNAPDLEKYPEYRQASPVTVYVEPGDVLYIPPGTLHHVTSLDTCISFNIDFHTKTSVLKSFAFLNKGMPKEVVYYNFIMSMGLIGRVPSKVLFPLYRSYLNYVS